ncbi:MAG: hypothetical protein D6769_00540 [Methanobacteriota archaeon]|nr:MAG: hypothetical protein D6769_00540 [Euryarchaeota archaeon]
MADGFEGKTGKGDGQEIRHGHGKSLGESPGKKQEKGQGKATETRTTYSMEIYGLADALIAREAEMRRRVQEEFKKERRLFVEKKKEVDAKYKKELESYYDMLRDNYLDEEKRLKESYVEKEKKSNILLYYKTIKNRLYSILGYFGYADKSGNVKLKGMEVKDAGRR